MRPPSHWTQYLRETADFVEEIDGDFPMILTPSEAREVADLLERIDERERAMFAVFVREQMPFPEGVHVGLITIAGRYHELSEIFWSKQ